MKWGGMACAAATDIELADAFEVLVHGLNEGVNEFQDGQLVLVVPVHGHNEEERGVSAVDHLVATVLDERALELRAGQASANDLSGGSDRTIIVETWHYSTSRSLPTSASSATRS